MGGQGRVRGHGQVRHRHLRTDRQTGGGRGDGLDTLEQTGGGRGDRLDTLEQTDRRGKGR